MKHIWITAGRFLATLILAVGVLNTSIDAAIESEESLAVYAGVVVSNNPALDSLVLVEFPFSVNRHEFSFFVPDTVDNGLFARVFAQVDLLDSTGHAIDSVATYFSMRVSSQQEADLRDYRVFNSLRMMVPPGDYSARLTVIDAVSKRTGEYFLERVHAEPPHHGKLEIGGARVAYDVRYIGEGGPQYNPRLCKNGFYVVPNPVSIFTPGDTVVYLYGEIYGLLYLPDDPTPYQLSLAILDQRDSVHQNLGSRVTAKPGQSAVIAESIDVTGFPFGSYNIRVVATDLDNGQSDTILTPFHIVSPQAILTAATTQYQVDYDDADLDIEDHVNMVKYLLVPEEFHVLTGLSDSGKMNYLAQFWAEHDINPATPLVENRRDLIERYRFSNQIFSTNRERSNGWASDRGRIYLTYGRWDERDDNEAPRIGNAYEIWHYRSIGEGKVFVFEDWSGSDDYRLVHSNVYGEVYSRDWQEKIDQGVLDVPD
ncbi:MAG: GWxTD domain-containing protein [Candidatus Zixiibacteriota bacterium]|nr:MAG: GWxTD domain-containing protein [candidate division Zixibacteria bacterium]